MRRKDRELTDVDEIIRIVEKAKILHLGLFDSDYPYVLPLHYGYEYADGILVLYLHSAKEGHKLDLIRTNPNVCVEMECDAHPAHPCAKAMHTRVQRGVQGGVHLDRLPSEDLPKCLNVLIFQRF